jgi:hypothetical protein
MPDIRLMAANCYDEKLINLLKILTIQTISIHFHLRDSTICAGNLAFPYPGHLKSSSPQRPMPDKEMIAGIFSGKVIIVEAGKIAVQYFSRNLIEICKVFLDF